MRQLYSVMLILIVAVQVRRRLVRWELDGIHLVDEPGVREVHQRRGAKLLANYAD